MESVNLFTNFEEGGIKFYYPFGESPKKGEVYKDELGYQWVIVGAGEIIFYKAYGWWHRLFTAEPDREHTMSRCISLDVAHLSRVFTLVGPEESILTKTFKILGRI